MPTFALALLFLAALGLAGALLRRARPALLPWRRIAGIELLAVGLWLVGGNLLASLAAGRAERAVRALDPAAVPASRAAAGEPSPAARAIVEIGSGLEVMKGTLARFVGGLERQADDHGPGLPDVLRAWLGTQQPAVAGLQAHLLGAGAVAWGASSRTDDRLAFRAATLSLLHDALLATAVERDEAGAAGVEDVLAAAERLTASLRDRPETAARVHALGQDRRLLGALRRLTSVPAGWEGLLDRLERGTRPLGAIPGELLDLLAGEPEQFVTLRALLLHVRIEGQLRGAATARRFGPAEAFLRLGGDVPLERGAEALLAERQVARSAFYRYVQGPLERPVLRLVAADGAAVLAGAAGAAAGAGRQATARLAAWSPLRPESLDLAPWVRRREAAFRAELELTRLVLRTRLARLRARVLPKARSLPEAASQACPQGRWTLESAPDGVWIRLEPNPFAEHEATVAFHLTR